MNLRRHLATIRSVQSNRSSLSGATSCTVSAGLEAVAVEHTDSRAKERPDACALFVFIGAEPCTTWLSDTLSTDADGFLLTGADLT